MSVDLAEQNRNTREQGADDQGAEPESGAGDRLASSGGLEAVLRAILWLTAGANDSLTFPPVFAWRLAKSEPGWYHLGGGIGEVFA